MLAAIVGFMPLRDSCSEQDSLINHDGRGGCLALRCEEGSALILRLLWSSFAASEARDRSDIGRREKIAATVVAAERLQTHMPQCATVWAPSESDYR
jgi:hypothetical protein